LKTCSETIAVGGVELHVVRPADPDALLDEDAFAEDEFLPYWAELWPAGLALAEALPPELAGLRVVELGCGLGVPSLVAAARGARVTAVDWAADAIALLRENAARNGLELETVHADWRSFDGRFDLVLAADVLYEARNVEPLAELVSRLALQALVGLAGRPCERGFLERARGFGRVHEHGRIARIEPRNARQRGETVPSPE
jgi:predicted nicotinamide N-methyase